MRIIELKGTIRETLGKKATKALRANQEVPCVVYGGEKNFHFSAQVITFRDLIYTNEFRKASIQLGDETIEAIVKDVQFHPVTDEILHIDFLQLVEGKKLTTELPVKVVGSAVGVKAGGSLVQKVRKVKVLTTPDLLSTALEVNVSHLEMGKSIRVREIEIPEGMQMMTSMGIPVASIEIPRALRSAQAKAAKA